MSTYLLIDDDVILNILHQEVIRKVDPSGEITVYNSSVRGLDYLKLILEKNEALPNYIFLDIRMPEMNGFEVLDELMKHPQSQFEKTRIFMLTSSLDDRDKTKAESYPIITGFRGKTVTTTMLKEIIDAET
ncbi:MAG: response regulator [Cryomorphaceae bacterium]|nr:response regulator [Cryomorphaceae bacterium]